MVSRLEENYQVHVFKSSGKNLYVRRREGGLLVGKVSGVYNNLTGRGELLRVERHVVDDDREGAELIGQMDDVRVSVKVKNGENLVRINGFIPSRMFSDGTNSSTLGAVGEWFYNRRNGLTETYGSYGVLATTTTTTNDDDDRLTTLSAVMTRQYLDVCNCGLLVLDVSSSSGETRASFERAQTLIEYAMPVWPRLTKKEKEDLSMGQLNAALFNQVPTTKTAAKRSVELTRQLEKQLHRVLFNVGRRSDSDKGTLWQRYSLPTCMNANAIGREILSYLRNYIWTLRGLANNADYGWGNKALFFIPAILEADHDPFRECALYTRRDGATEDATAKKAAFSQMVANKSEPHHYPLYLIAMYPPKRKDQQTEVELSFMISPRDGHNESEDAYRERVQQYAHYQVNGQMYRHYGFVAFGRRSNSNKQKMGFYLRMGNSEVPNVSERETGGIPWVLYINEQFLQAIQANNNRDILAYGPPFPHGQIGRTDSVFDTRHWYRLPTTTTGSGDSGDKLNWIFVLRFVFGFSVASLKVAYSIVIPAAVITTQWFAVGFGGVFQMLGAVLLLFRVLLYLRLIAENPAIRPVLRKVLDLVGELPIPGIKEFTKTVAWDSFRQIIEKLTSFQEKVKQTIYEASPASARAALDTLAEWNAQAWLNNAVILLNFYQNPSPWLLIEPYLIRPAVNAFMKDWVLGAKTDMVTKHRYHTFLGKEQEVGKELTPIQGLQQTANHVFNLANDGNLNSAGAGLAVFTDPDKVDAEAKRAFRNNLANELRKSYWVEVPGIPLDKNAGTNLHPTDAEKAAMQYYDNRTDFFIDLVRKMCSAASNKTLPLAVEPKSVFAMLEDPTKPYTPVLHSMLVDFGLRFKQEEQEQYVPFTEIKWQGYNSNSSSIPPEITLKVPETAYADLFQAARAAHRKAIRSTYLENDWTGWLTDMILTEDMKENTGIVIATKSFVNMFLMIASAYTVPYMHDFLTFWLSAPRPTPFIRALCTAANNTGTDLLPAYHAATLDQATFDTENSKWFGSRSNHEKYKKLLRDSRRHPSAFLYRYLHIPSLQYAFSYL